MMENVKVYGNKGLCRVTLQEVGNQFSNGEAISHEKLGMSQVNIFFARWMPKQLKT